MKTIIFLKLGAENWDRLNSFINTKKAFKKLKKFLW